jgi:integrase
MVIAYAELVSGRYATKDNIKFTAFVERYQENHMSKNRETTQQTSANMLEKYVVPELGEKKMFNIGVEDIEDLTNKLIRTQSQQYTRNIIKEVRSVFSKAQDWDYIAKNPALKVKLPEEVKPEYKFMTEENINHLVKTSIHHDLTLKDACIILLAGYQGLRRGEVFGLQWGDVTLDWEGDQFKQIESMSKKNTISIQRQIVNGKVAEPKTKSSKAAIPLRRLPAWFLFVWYMAYFLWIKANIEDDIKLQLPPSYHPIKPTDWIFPRFRDRSRPMDGGNYTRRKFKELLKLAGISDDYTFHSLRHSCATILVNKGVPMKLVQAFMRHSKYQITADIYAHPTFDSMQESIYEIEPIVQSKFGGKIDGKTKIKSVTAHLT